MKFKTIVDYINYSVRDFNIIHDTYVCYTRIIQYTDNNGRLPSIKTPHKYNTSVPSRRINRILTNVCVSFVHTFAF